MSALEMQPGLQPYEYHVVSVATDAGDLLGYRLRTADLRRQSRLYLSREDALQAWVNRSIEWEWPT